MRLSHAKIVRMSNFIGDRERELDEFKRVNLSVIAASYGYAVVRKKTTRHSVLMESGNDKIIISKSGGDYIYCSVYNSSSGTAIDFAQQVIESRCNLGRAMQLLRPFLSGSFYSSALQKHAGSYATEIKPSSRDFVAVAARLTNFQPITGHHPYLCDERQIPAELLQHPRIRGRVRHSTKYSSIIFPHYGAPETDPNSTDRCINGYEIKGQGVNMFSKGGRKGLFASAAFDHDKVLAVAESGLDALSYLTLHGPEETRAVSISGQINPFQPELLKSAIGKMGQGAQVVAAFDNDPAGDKLTETLMQIVSECGRSDIEFRDHRPQQRDQDWNAVLQSVSPAPPLQAEKLSLRR